MNCINQIVTTTVNVTEFCNQLERSLLTDHAFVQCLCQTNWKTLSQRATVFQNELANDTKKVLSKIDSRLNTEFTIVYQKTNGKCLTRFIESYTAKLNSETEWFLTWCDIWLRNVNEKNGFNKMVRECTKVNKARAKADASDAKQKRKQTRKPMHLSKQRRRQL
jgi:hypothetical protein